jgi:hypothetical protein
MSLSAIPRELRERVFQRDNGRCRYCGLAQVGQGSMFHINHVIPRSRGGATVEQNLVLQCPWCSLHKSNKLQSVDPQSGELIQLFHPMNDDWSKHFQLGSDGTCVGTSPTGRATVDALQMNETLPRIARAVQIRIGIIEATR